MSEAPKPRFGPYLTPVFAIGTFVECESRGLVEIVGLSEAPIRWPIGLANGERQLVMYKALARAVRLETPAIVAACFGVPLEVAESWQRHCQRPRSRKKQTRASLPVHWKREEDEMLMRLSLSEAARLTGRTITAVRKRRRVLGLPDARFTEARASRVPSLAAQVADVRQRFAANYTALNASVQKLQAACAYAKTNAAYWSAKNRQVSKQTVGQSKPATS
ncbi:MAG TPA: hypothetical protein VGI40_04830 [Pirellulaceae bacterium]